MVQDDARTVEVFQPRSQMPYLNEDRDGPEEGFEDIYNDLRDLAAGMLDAEDIDMQMFGRLWSLAGTEVVHKYPYEDDSHVLGVMWERWNNGSGKESDAFRQANQEKRAVSMSTGDIVRVDGTAYLCESVGWTELEEVSL